MFAVVEPDTGGSGISHMRRLCSVFSVCVCVCFKCRDVVSPATFPAPQRDTLQGSGGGTGLTLCDKSLFHSQSHCLRGSPSPSVPLSLLFMLLRVSRPPSTNLHPSSPPHSPPLHFHLYSILRAAHLSFVVYSRLFLISLYLPPSSCSSFGETMLLRGCRGTQAEAATIILLQRRSSTHGRAKGKSGRLEGECAVLIHLAEKFDRAELV